MARNLLELIRFEIRRYVFSMPFSTKKLALWKFHSYLRGLIDRVLRLVHFWWQCRMLGCSDFWG